MFSASMLRVVYYAAEDNQISPLLALVASGKARLQMLPSDDAWTLAYLMEELILFKNLSVTAVASHRLYFKNSENKVACCLEILRHR